MPSSDHQEIERAVRDLEERRCNATNANDAVALEKLFVEDYVHVHANALVHNRAEMIHHTTTNARTVEPRPPKVRVFGDVAILTGDLVNVVVRDGKTIYNRLFATQVACKTSGGWKFASFQATRLPE